MKCGTVRGWPTGRQVWCGDNTPAAQAFTVPLVLATTSRLRCGTLRAPRSCMLRHSILALLIASSALTGCSAHQMQSTGATLGLLGGATTIVGIGVAAGCEPFPDEGTTCENDSWEPDPVNGFRVSLVGLFALGLGALMIATASDDSSPNSSSTAEPRPAAAHSPSTAPREPAPREIEEVVGAEWSDHTNDFVGAHNDEQSSTPSGR